jgi:predicted SprT family Zn-dependent metalloprotease
MNLDTAATHARSLMQMFALDGWSFNFDNAKTRCGQCSHKRKRITLSRYYAELNSLAEVHETILHEIAHALTPGAGHGPKWRAMAQEIGAKPQRCADANVNMPAGKWRACCTCGYADILTRHRKPSRSLYCRRCETRVVWVDNTEVH